MPSVSIEKLQRNCYAPPRLARAIAASTSVCGEALGCPVLLARGASVLLYDPAERMRGLAGERHGVVPGVTLLDRADLEPCRLPASR
jgi:hypothetical protein